PAPPTLRGTPGRGVLSPEAEGRSPDDGGGRLVPHPYQPAHRQNHTRLQVGCQRGVDSGRSLAGPDDGARPSAWSHGGPRDGAGPARRYRGRREDDALPAPRGRGSRAAATADRDAAWRGVHHPSVRHRPERLRVGIPAGSSQELPPGAPSGRRPRAASSGRALAIPRQPGTRGVGLLPATGDGSKAGPAPAGPQDEGTTVAAPPPQGQARAT